MSSSTRSDGGLASGTAPVAERPRVHPARAREHRPVGEEGDEPAVTELRAQGPGVLDRGEVVRERPPVVVVERQRRGDDRRQLLAEHVRGELAGDASAPSGEPHERADLDRVPVEDDGVAVEDRLSGLADRDDPGPAGAAPAAADPRGGRVEPPTQEVAGRDLPRRRRDRVRGHAGGRQCPAYPEDAGPRRRVRVLRHEVDLELEAVAGVGPAQALVGAVVAAVDGEGRSAEVVGTRHEPLPAAVGRLAR